MSSKLKTLIEPLDLTALRAIPDCGGLRHLSQTGLKPYCITAKYCPTIPPFRGREVVVDEVVWVSSHIWRLLAVQVAHALREWKTGDSVDSHVIFGLIVTDCEDGFVDEVLPWRRTPTRWAYVLDFMAFVDPLDICPKRWRLW